MNSDELRNWISDLTQDIPFLYQGKNGLVMPRSEHDILLCFGDEDIRCSDIEMTMSVPLFDGKSLSQIADQIELI